MSGEAARSGHAEGSLKRHPFRMPVAERDLPTAFSFLSWRRREQRRSEDRRAEWPLYGMYGQDILLLEGHLISRTRHGRGRERRPRQHARESDTSALQSFVACDSRRKKK